MRNSMKALLNRMQSLPRRIVAIVAAVVILLTGTIVVTACSAYSVEIVADGESRSVITTHSDAQKILNKAKVTVGEDDKVDLSEFVAGEDSRITVYRACSVQVRNNEGFDKTLMAAGTVADAVKKSGMELKPSDELNFENTDLLKEGMEIKVLVAFPVTIEADGQTYEIELAKGNVEDALKKAKIEIDEDDETEPSRDTVLTEETTIKVYRIEYKEYTEEETVKFKTYTSKTIDLYKDQSRVIQKGSDGKKEVTYRERYVNGELEKTTVANTKVITPVVHEKIEYGVIRRVKNIKLKPGLKPISELTVPSSVKINSKGVPTSYKKYIDGKAAAYTGGTSTSTGRKPMPGLIAVNPKQIPYGTAMWIVSLDGNFVYGYAIAADTGGFVQRKTFTVDLYMNTYEDCCRWGARQVRIYIL